jgi:transposase
VTEIRKLIKAYKHQDSVTELAKQFGIHRLTVTALLRRHGVEQRPVGLTPTEIPEAASLYGQGWSLVRLGEAFGVDASTVWRALRAAGVVMRPPGQSRQGRY